MKINGFIVGKVISLIAFITMLVALLYGFIFANFFSEGSLIISVPWGIITLIDIYISFLVFCGWIIYREKTIYAKIIWVIFVLVLGSFTIAIYLFIAFQTCEENWQKFWHGKRQNSVIIAQ